MPFRLLAIAMLLFTSGATLLAQDLTGTWQGTLSTPAAQVRIVLRTQPLTFVRATPQTAWTIPEPPPPPVAMAAAADPGIEVATIKLSPPDVRGRGIGFRGATLNVTNYNLLNRKAEHLRGIQRATGPEAGSHARAGRHHRHRQGRKAVGELKAPLKGCPTERVPY